MALALPTQTFADVQKYMRQKRAVGQQVTPTEERSAWQAYWDVMAARQGEAERIGLEHERIGLGREQLEIQEEQMKRQQRAAMVSGIGQIGSTMAMGAYALKGTKLGGKIGLGAPGEGIPSVAPTAGQVSAMGAGYGPVTADVAAKGFGAAAPTVGEAVVPGVAEGALVPGAFETAATGAVEGAAATGTTTSAATGMGTSLASGAATMGVGLVGTGIGMGAKALIPGDKPVAEGAAGAVGGAMAGAAIGSVVPVVGTAVGAVVGGIAGTFGGGK